jgi:ATP-dependent protease HslVU (ClpYQ) peptidase subunit
MVTGPSTKGGEVVRAGQVGRGAGAVYVGFAGKTSDAVALYEQFEKELGKASGDPQRAAVQLSRAGRSQRDLEASLLVMAGSGVLMVSGSGDVVSAPSRAGCSVLAIGSGGREAAAAAWGAILSAQEETYGVKEADAEAVPPAAPMQRIDVRSILLDPSVAESGTGSEVSASETLCSERIARIAMGVAAATDIYTSGFVRAFTIPSGPLTTAPEWS